MFMVVEWPSLCFVSYIVMSGLVAGLFQHNHAVTLSDYCFYSVSDVYVPLGTSRPALSRPEQAGPRPRPCAWEDPSHWSSFSWSFLSPSPVPETGQGWQCHHAGVPWTWIGTHVGLRPRFLPSEHSLNLCPEHEVALMLPGAPGPTPTWLSLALCLDTPFQEGSLASRLFPVVDAEFLLQNCVGQNCQSGADMLS